MKKIPERMCVVTKEKMPKKELLRVVRTPDSKIIVDQSGKQNGKGAYLKKDEQVIAQAQKSKVLEKILEVKISDDDYEAMRNAIK